MTIIMDGTNFVPVEWDLKEHAPGMRARIYTRPSKRNSRGPIDEQVVKHLSRKMCNASRR